MSDFLPDLQELAPVHEGSISNLHLRTTSRAARAAWLRSRLQHRASDAPAVRGLHPNVCAGSTIAPSDICTRLSEVGERCVSRG